MFGKEALFVAFLYKLMGKILWLIFFAFLMPGAFRRVLVPSNFLPSIQ